MASKLTSRPFLTALKRRLSAQAQVIRNETTEAGFQVTKLPSGLTVASMDSSTPVARVALIVAAGPRHERHDQRGVTHFLRSSTDIATKRHTSFEVTRMLQQLGANFNCTSTRESTIYSLDCYKEAVKDGMDLLSSVTSGQIFQPWEVKDIHPRMALDLAILRETPEINIVELIHEAAFRDVLGRSLYAPSDMLGSYDTDTLLEFVNNNYTSDRTVLAALGVDHQDLISYGKALPTRAGSADTSQGKYHGGELRRDVGGELVHAVIVTEGASLGHKDAVSLSLLQHVMGCGPTVKWSSNAGAARLSQAASQATDEPFAASSFNASYKDSGLFGFYAVAQSANIGKVLNSLVGQFRAVTKSGVTDQEVSRAKTQLKASLAMQSESSGDFVQAAASQLLTLGSITAYEALVKTIDATTTDEVNSVAKRVINGKPSMAATGNLHNTPFLDQLM